MFKVKNVKIWKEFDEFVFQLKKFKELGKWDDALKYCYIDYLVNELTKFRSGIFGDFGRHVK